MTVKPRRTMPRVLLAMLLVASACNIDASEASDGVGPESTTSPGPSTSLVPDSPDTAALTTTTTAPTTTLPPLDPPTYESVEGINTIGEFSGLTARGLSRWEQAVPGVEDIRITSTADGADQPALWLAPKGDNDRPLILILHSWSSNYVQHAGIPYAMWAQENGWAVIAPDFRGINDDADAVGSDLAVQDVIDAIDFATSQEGVDPNRVYAVGYSGGGMMALLLAGRHPERVTAVAAWGGPYDLVEFYRQSRAAGRRYSNDLTRACGGDPTSAGPARRDCRRRSPMRHLDGAREFAVPVFIGQGIHDSLLSPSQGARAFNQLADPEDRFSDEELEHFGGGSIPEHLAGTSSAETFLGDGDPTPVFARHSAAVWLVFFQANHEMVYHAAMRFFASDPR